MELIDGGALELHHSRKYENLCPQLGWNNAPPETASFLLAMVDIHPDSRGDVHWLVDRIPAEVGEIEGGGAVTGHELTPYTGPLPPEGTHEYAITLYALDAEAPELPPAITLDDALARLDGHVLATSTLNGSFTRPAD